MKMPKRDLIAIIERAYADGLAATDIAGLTTYAPNYIRRIAKRFGIKRPNKSASLQLMQLVNR